MIPGTPIDVADIAAFSLGIAALALLIERIVGWPAFLQRLAGHPVEWIGALVGGLDRLCNRERLGGGLRYLLGVVALATVAALVLAVTLPVTLWLRGVPYGWLAEAVLCVPLLSQRSLRQHVHAVADALASDVAAGRRAVSHIIGRDPAELDEAEIACGAIESLAENTSDGVVAPAFWLLLAGLPGIALYKAVNTADSMIGHRSDRHRHFGWASARLDDFVNLVPARATALLFVVTAAFVRNADAAAALRAARRDAPRHVSPNAGWPEAAMAGALGLSLGGPRSYGGRRVDLATMGDGRRELAGADITRALSFYDTSLSLFFAAIAVFAAAAWAL